MIQTADDPSVYPGDVYILQSGEVIGVMEAMKFRCYPRLLLNRFFSAVDVKNPGAGGSSFSAQPPSTRRNFRLPWRQPFLKPLPKPFHKWLLKRLLKCLPHLRLFHNKSPLRNQRFSRQRAVLLPRP